MKVLAVFMTILVLVTGFDLCDDQDIYESKETVQLSNTEDNGGHREEAPCTPFCHCARCPFSVVLPAIVEKLPLISLRTEKHDIYVIQNASRFTPAIWQPPKYIRG